MCVEYVLRWVGYVGCFGCICIIVGVVCISYLELILDLEDDEWEYLDVVVGCLIMVGVNGRESKCKVK